MIDTVVYHFPCHDGFTAAWVAWEKFPDAEFIPAKYGDEPPDLKGKNVLMVDISWDRATMIRLHKEAEFLIVLDHHKTARENLEGLDFATFDMERSGAGLVWDYLYPHDPRSVLVNYVEDRDLWRWALPNSKAISAYISLQKMTFLNWRRLDIDLYENRDVVLLKGGAVKAYIDHYSEEMFHASRLVYIPALHHRPFPVVNMPYTNVSEALNYIANHSEEKVALAWMQRGDGMFQYSLRSADDGPDVGQMARVYGGGGHPHAAGFVMNYLLSAIYPVD